jgi:DNA-binding LacI/PurR family transcriptional regulator
MDRAGSQPVRMIDIARQAGCTRAVVSHVLSGTGEGQIRVGPQKAELIRQIAAQLEFHPNHAAQQLKGKRSKTLGVVSKAWNRSFHLRVFYWIQQAAAERGYQVLTAQAASIKELRGAIRQFLSRGLDGAMCFAQGSEALGPLGEPIVARLPRLVSLYGRTAVPGAVFVDVDEADGIRQALEHLHQRGRTRIALLLAEECEGSQQRREGFLEASRRLGLSAAAEQVYAGTSDWDWERPGVHDVIDAWIEQVVVGAGADAVIAHDDFGAAFLIQGLARRGLRVPRDVAVVGYENDLISHHLAPPLSTVHMPVREVAEAAVAMLVQAAEEPGSRPLVSRTFKPRLMVRGSS